LSKKTCKLHEVSKLINSTTQTYWWSWTWKYHFRGVAIRFSYNCYSNKQFLTWEQDWKRWIWWSLQGKKQ